MWSNLSKYYTQHCDDNKETLYLALTGELWSVFCEDIGENWLHDNGTALYCVRYHM